MDAGRGLQQRPGWHCRVAAGVCARAPQYVGVGGLVQEACCLRLRRQWAVPLVAGSLVPPYLAPHDILRAPPAPLATAQRLFCCGCLAWSPLSHLSRVIWRIV